MCGDGREKSVERHEKRTEDRQRLIRLLFFYLTTAKTETETGFKPRQDMRTEYDDGKTDKQDVMVIHGSTSMMSAQQD